MQNVVLRIEWKGTEVFAIARYPVSYGTVWTVRVGNHVRLFAPRRPVSR